MSIKDKILIVEDDEGILNYLHTTLLANNYQVIAATDGKSALALAASHCPTCILLDLGLPDMDGCEVIRLIRQWSTTPIIVISARSTETDKAEALDTGADDYLPKPFDMGELIARVRAMLRRREEFHPDLIRFGDLTLNMRSGEICTGDISFQLPRQEYRLMEQLVLNHTMYMSTEDLLVKAWGYNTETDINSVWLYVSYLRKRLSAMNSKVEIVSKRNIGYKLEFQP